MTWSIPLVINHMSSVVHLKFQVSQRGVATDLR